VQRGGGAIRVERQARDAKLVPEVGRATVTGIDADPSMKANRRGGEGAVERLARVPACSIKLRTTFDARTAGESVSSNSMPSARGDENGEPNSPKLRPQWPASRARATTAIVIPVAIRRRSREMIATPATTPNGTR
jgi:hypothetical protein